MYNPSNYPFFVVLFFFLRGALLFPPPPLFFPSIANTEVINFWVPIPLTCGCEFRGTVCFTAEDVWKSADFVDVSLSLQEWKPTPSLLKTCGNLCWFCWCFTFFCQSGNRPSSLLKMCGKVLILLMLTFWAGVETGTHHCWRCVEISADFVGVSLFSAKMETGTHHYWSSVGICADFVGVSLFSC